jgi:phosphate transport system permease protein
MARITAESKTPTPKPLPQRFEISKFAHLIDRAMTYIITVGGIGVVIAVLGIFVFILWQILPLFQAAHVEPLQSYPLPPAPYKVLGADEWTAYPVLLTADGQMSFFDLVGARGQQQVDLGFPPDVTFSAFAYDQEGQEIVFATQDGRFSVVQVNYKATFGSGYDRTVTAAPQAGPLLNIGKPGYRIVQVAYGDGGMNKLAAALQDVDGKLEVHAVTLTQKRTLLGRGKTVLEETFDLTSMIAGEPQHIAVNDQADGIVVSTRAGDVYYFFRDGGKMVRRQVFTPFKDRPDATIASMHYLLGGVSLILANSGGENRMFSLHVPEGSATRLFAQTKTFSELPGSASFYAASLRNKAFLIGEDTWASLRYATTSATRWQQELPFSITRALIGGKYDRLLFLDASHRLHVYRLRDPHPEAGFKALFSKIWYEGASAPRYVWQSTGGTDDFEPKLSLVPVIIGTLKGTLYAMLFAVPIALLAALYTSQFLHPNLRTIVKPTMEIMASLPSVILGFLAALWLAPVLETRVPSFLLIVVCVPLSALIVGRLWSDLPLPYRMRIKPGYEFLAFMPILLLVAYGAWHLGPVLERLLFVTTDPSSGVRVADFRLWWTQVTGLSFEQRNSLVVGFMMGFAVIPIVFTISEDSLSSVPPVLKSGSLALGASRWQTAIRIILPTASAGIFSAIMIGLGRAVGETMIVLMATGNTPIMDFNIFSGMRTLSANIAVELPEAPQFGTLYRTLFLGALMLFLMTFMVNTLAEIVRQRLRERFKTV